MRKLVATAFLTLTFFAPLSALAQFNSGDSGLGVTGSTAYGTDITGKGNIAVFIGTYVIQPVLGLLGLLFLCLMIYAGVLWMTATGNEKKVQKAKDIMVAAVIGATIIVAAYAVTNAVFNGLTTGSISGSTPVSSSATTPEGIQFAPSTPTGP